MPAVATMVSRTMPKTCKPLKPFFAGGGADVDLSSVVSLIADGTALTRWFQFPFLNFALQCVPD